MSYNNFPSIIAPSYDTEEVYVKRKIAVNFENGIEFSRQTATIGKHKFMLNFRSISEADFQTLKSFFISQGSTPFNWTDPATNTSYVVRFPIGELQSKHLWNDRRSVQLELHEIPNA